MDLLLDSHAMLWFFWDDPELSADAKRLIEDPDNRKLTLGEPCRSFLNREIFRNNFELLSVSLDHATSVEELPQHHRDPFDRLLIAQAYTEHLTVITKDALFKQYKIETAW